MKQILAAFFVTVAVAISQAQNNGATNGGTPNKSQSQTPAQTEDQQNAQAHPRRVRAKLDGFDLAPEAGSANQAGGASRGNGHALLLYAPHKARVFTERPSFSWQGQPGANYKFHLQDATGQFVWEREVSGTSLDYPADAPALDAGKTYLWRVYETSSMFAQTTPSAIIVELGDPERGQLEAALNDIQASGVDAEKARAQLYFDHRLWYDAVMAYSDLIAKHPHEADLYLKRGSLYDQLAATEALADKDFSRAE